MTPGVNNGPRNTGTIPKSNCRSDRNRERSAAYQQNSRSSLRQQHSNNLFQLDWQPVSEREPCRTTKNSNNRSTSSIPSTLHHDYSDFVSQLSGRQYNYATEECPPWQNMAPPTDSRTHSPPRLQGTKPKNVDKMPDRSEVETRLNQIRDYIRVTSTMMESLSQSSDPKARAQHEKLTRMVEDLYDSETKLSHLLEDCNRRIPDESGDHPEQRTNQMRRFSELVDVLSSSQDRFLLYNYNCENGENGRHDCEENGDSGRESQLRRKMEESQRKLAQLQEHQANLVGMQLQVRERLNEARQQQQALLQQENQSSATTSSSAWDLANHLPAQISSNAQELESETAALRGKLAQLQNKKKHMDYLVSELQTVDLSEKGSCTSESSRNLGRDKAAELEAMKAQLAHLKALMDEATRVRESLEPSSEPEPDADGNIDGCDEPEIADEENAANALSSNSFPRHNDGEEATGAKLRKSDGRPTVDQVQAVTRELKEQSALLQAARAELQRLKQPLIGTVLNPSSRPSSSPPPSLVGLPTGEKKQSNNNSSNSNANGDAPQTQIKRRQWEDLMRKEQSHSSSVNRDLGGAEWSSRRGSNSQLSHTSTPGNLWPPPAAVGGSNEQSVDGISSSDHLLDIGPQTTAIENGFSSGTWWGLPAPPVGQPPQGSAEYYRQLLLSSQAQQLQMMGTTMQQCCQLLWAQQRELQSMRLAITQLQQQLKQPQPRMNNVENQEGYSNLSRSTHHLGSTLDAALPPSSSLPNLVSLPNSSPAPPQTPVLQAANPQQHHQHQQLNNQVPPGNRANNYWDNFRSYSRQNLLSGTPKTDSIPGPSSNSIASTGNAASGGVNSSLVKDKRNREHGADNLPLPSFSGAEAHYSLNLQLPSNIQQHEREIAGAHSNILSNDGSLRQQVDNLWEESHSTSHILPGTLSDDFYSFRHLSPEMREVLGSLITANRRRPDYLVIILREIKAISEDHRLRPHLLRSLRALQDTQSLSNPLDEATDQTASDSCQSSDDDSEIVARGLLSPNIETQPPFNGCVSCQSSATPKSSVAIAPIDNFEHLEPPLSLDRIGLSFDNSNAVSSSTLLTPGYNEDLAEADQSRPEASNNQQSSNEDSRAEDNEDEEGAAAAMIPMLDPVGSADTQNGEEAEERAEDIILDKIPTRLCHH